MSTAARTIHKLFVGNISWTVSSRELKQYFSEFGHVISANVVFDRNTGLSKNYGFVSFSTQSGVDTVLSKPYHSLEGTNLIIQTSN